MTVTLCVLLWARDGREAELIAYENDVLVLLPDHGGRVLQRARRGADSDGPLEVHFLEFPSEDALSSYMSDGRRLAMGDARDQAVERTDVLRVDLV